MSYGKIMDALRKANFVNKEGAISKYIYDKVFNGIYIEEFLCDLFDKADEITSYKIDIIDAFDSPGYDCSVLAVSWIDLRGLHMEMFLLESY